MASSKPMQEKVDILKKLSIQDLVDRIKDYPDQNHLNFYDDGTLREYPVGDVATAAIWSGYHFSKTEQEMLASQFAKLTTPEVILSDAQIKASGQDPLAVKGNPVSMTKDQNVYEAKYKLIPHSSMNGQLHVSVICYDENNSQWIGDLDKRLTEQYPMKDQFDVTGTMMETIMETRNPTVSYHFEIDLEKLHKLEDDRWRKLHPMQPAVSDRSYAYTEEEFTFINKFVEQVGKAEEETDVKEPLSFDDELAKLKTFYEKRQNGGYFAHPGTNMTL